MNPLSFILETIQRFFMKSPKYWKIWQLITASLSLAGYTPSIFSLFGLHTSEAFVGTTKAIGIFFTGWFTSSLLATKSIQVSVNEDGEVLKKTNEAKMPFTAKSEKIEAIKSGVEVSLEMK